MATGLIGALRVTLGIDASEFVAGTKKAQAEMRSFQREFERTGKKWQSLGKDMTQWVTLPILAAGAGVMKLAGDFETAMIQVGISTGATNEELARMSELAKEIGGRTIFSAKEAAEGMDMLAKAGIETTAILGGAADAVTDLAAAAGSGLEPAAAAISDAMIQFGLTAEQLPNVVNRITGAVNMSKLSFQDFTMAAGMAGGVAGSAGISFDDFTTALAGTSAMFSSGSDAGTSFKTFLMRLVPDTKKAREAMEAFGFSAYDANGKLLPLRDIAEQLQTKFSGMSEMERAGLFKAMFGQDAIRSAIGLMKLGGEGIDELNAKIAAVDASAQAEARMQGFNASMEKFQGAIENLAIAIGDSGMLESLTGLVEGLADFIDWLSKASPETLKWTTIILGLAAALGPVVLVVGTLVRGIGMALPIIKGISAAFGILTTALGYLMPVIAGIARVLIGGLLAHPVLAGAALLITGIYLAWKHWDKIVPIVRNMVTGIKNWLGTQLQQVFDGVRQKVDAVKSWFAGLYDAVVGNSYIPDMVEGIRIEMDKLDEVMVQPAKKAAEAAAQAFADMKSKVGGILERLFPEEAKFNTFLEELAVLEKGMKALGFTAEQTAEAVKRLRAQWMEGMAGGTTAPRPTNNDDALGGIGPAHDVTGPGDVENIYDEANKTNDEILKDTKKTTSEMAVAWAEMARDAVSSLRNMVSAFKGGDILGGITQLLDIISQVAGLLGGSLGGATAVFNRAPTPVMSEGGAIGMATGGTMKVGGVGGVDSQLIRMRATPGELIDVRRGDQGRRNPVQVFVTPSPFFDARVEEVARPMTEDAAQRGAVGGAALSARQRQRQVRSSLR